MSALKRPFAVTAASLLLALSLTACGGDGDDDKKADDKKSSESSSDASDDKSADGGDDTDGGDDKSDDGGGDDNGNGGTPAGSKDFCGNVADVFTALGAVKGEEPTEDEWNDIRDAFEDLGKGGIPADATKDEKAGFEVGTEVFSELTYDEAQPHFGSEDGDSIPGVSDAEEQQIGVFFAYAAKTCPDAISGLE